jgi:hypothetical protein
VEVVVTIMVVEVVVTIMVEVVVEVVVAIQAAAATIKSCEQKEEKWQSQSSKMLRWKVK